MQKIIITLIVLSFSPALAWSNVLLTSLPAYIHSNWWQPHPGTSWQWQLSGQIDTSHDVDMYDVDLFETPVSTIQELQERNVTVICYISCGSWESYRQDAHDFPQNLIGQTLAGWPDEKWLDIRRIDLLEPLIAKRFDLAKEKGCDGIEPDNIDGYQNDTGFPLTYEDQLTYNKWLSKQAHSRGLSIGLKNDLEQVEDLVDHFDWALNEECFFYDECELLLPFIEKNKAVFGVEYELENQDFCPQANSFNFDFLKKETNLGSYRQSCR